MDFWRVRLRALPILRGGSTFAGGEGTVPHYMPYYYTLFELHMNYACIKWGQNISSIDRLISTFSRKRH